MRLAHVSGSIQEETMKTAVRENNAASAVKIPPVGSPRHEDALLDQALLETFPASDPISPALEARMQAVEATESSDRATTRSLSRRLLRVAPTLVTFGVLAIALSAVRSAKSGRLPVR
jgi:hypothetical protein